MKDLRNKYRTDTFRTCQITHTRILKHNDDADRVKEAELLTDIEFGADWDAVLTVRYSTALDDENLIAHVKMMLKQKVFNQYFYSTYIHRQVHDNGIPYDYHAHIYLRHKSRNRREIKENRILSLKKAWYYTGNMVRVQKRYFSDETNPSATIHFQVQTFTDKTNNALGSYASYGIKRGVNETKLFGFDKYPVFVKKGEIVDIHKILSERGKHLRDKYGFTWNELKTKESLQKKMVMEESKQRNSLTGNAHIEYLRGNGLSAQRLLELYGIPLSS